MSVHIHKATVTTAGGSDRKKSDISNELEKQTRYKRELEKANEELRKNVAVLESRADWLLGFVGLWSSGI